MTDDGRKADRTHDVDGDATGGVPPLAERRGVERVYQPAEDSRLLASTVVERVDRSDLLVDVGTGSGYVAARVREATGARVLGTDLNPHACRQAADAGVPVLRGDRTTAVREGAADVVAFNPPYLPTDPHAEWDDWMEAALSGGESGRVAIDPFLDDLTRVLAPDGAAYLLVSTLTDPEEVRRLAAAAGLTAEQVAAESYPFEQLLVLELEPV